jgi:hypothetical protein
MNEIIDILGKVAFVSSLIVNCAEGFLLLLPGTIRSNEREKSRLSTASKLVSISRSCFVKIGSEDSTSERQGDNRLTPILLPPAAVRGSASSSGRVNCFFDRDSLCDDETIQYLAERGMTTRSVEHPWASLSSDILASADAEREESATEDYSPTTTHSSCSSASIDEPRVSSTTASSSCISRSEHKGGARENRCSAFDRSETSPFIARSLGAKRRLQETATNCSLSEESDELVFMPPLKCVAVRRPAASYPTNFRRAPTVIPACAAPLAHSFNSVAGPAQEFCPILPVRASSDPDSPQKTADAKAALYAPAEVGAAVTTAATSTCATEEAFFSAAEIEAAFRCVSGATVCSDLSDDWSGSPLPCGSPCMDELLIFSLDL